MMGARSAVRAQIGQPSVSGINYVLMPVTKG